MILLKLRAVWALLKRVPWQVWLVVAVALTALLWGNHRYSEGRADERAKWEAAMADARAKAEEANAASAEMRIEDIVKNIEAERARNEAIDQAIPAGSPSQAPDAANRALACARLRAAGLDTPSSCR